MTDALTAMLRARSIALVGASSRPGSFGERMVQEVSRSSGERRLHLINPRGFLPSLEAVDEPLDLVLLAVGDDVLDEQLSAAAALGARSAVVFGSASRPGQRARLAAIAREAGMALCGAGCMGFVNVAEGVRAIGYSERPSVPVGPIALVTHSGSVFSALLRTRRALGWTLAVSSGQELVTTSADYLTHILDETDTRVVALVLETIRDGAALVAGLRRAAERDIPVVVLPVGGSPLGAAMVSAHSGALAGATAAWEALAEGTGVRLVSDLAELTDTLELLSAARAPRPGGRGIATVHDSGAERTLVSDLAHELGVPFAPLAPATLTRLDALLDDGLTATNPLDLWGTGADTTGLVAGALRAMAADPAVSALALAVDLVEEYDGDTSYPDAVLEVARDPSCDVPLAVLTNLPCAVDAAAAQRLRAAGVPVLEGTRSGLAALRHLLAPRVAPPPPAVIDTDRQARWAARLALGELDGAGTYALLADYGVPTVPVRAVASAGAAVTAATALGYPVVLKTDAPGIAHKSDVGGVALALPDAEAVRTAYVLMADRLGPQALLCAHAAPGVELTLGLTRDPQLGALVVVGAGGVLTELLDDRAVALPPLTAARAERLILGLRVARLLDGYRGTAPVDIAPVIAALRGLGQLAAELGDHVEALDVNPFVAGPGVAVDALVVPRG